MYIYVYTGIHFLKMFVVCFNGFVCFSLAVPVDVLGCIWPWVSSFVCAMGMVVAWHGVEVFFSFALLVDMSFNIRARAGGVEGEVQHSNSVWGQETV